MTWSYGWSYDLGGVVHFGDVLHRDDHIVEWGVGITQGNRVDDYLCVSFDWTGQAISRLATLRGYILALGLQADSFPWSIDSISNPCLTTCS